MHFEILSEVFLKTQDRDILMCVTTKCVHRKLFECAQLSKGASEHLFNYTLAR